MKNARPEAYERMGRIILEDAGEREAQPAAPAQGGAAAKTPAG